MPKVVVATRRSELALAQCRQFLQTWVRCHEELEIEELHVTTTGDRITDRPLAEIGGKGLFLKEIEEALLDGRADLAVHSMKDVPPEIHPDLTIACIPVREDPRDVIITFDGRPFRELPDGAVLGTSSLRRSVQLGALRPDLRIVPIRGNVGTRIRKCREREVDVTVLAAAGLSRLGLTREAAEILSPERCLPAVGQGALAIEIRKADARLADLLSVVVDPETSITSMAERGVLAVVEGDCRTPVASFALREGQEMWLRGLLAEPDGRRMRRSEVRVPWPADPGEAAEIGRALGRRLRDA